MKRVITMTISLLFVGAMYAQTNGMGGFTVGASNERNSSLDVSLVIGQPFAGAYAQNGREVTFGMPQAQLDIQNINAVIYEGESYTNTENGWNYDQPEAGTYTNSKYLVNGGQYNYDLKNVLNLRVLPPFVCGGTTPVFDVDNYEYLTVELGGYCWTQQNLRTLSQPDGNTPIAKALVYNSELSPNEDDNVETFGRLYTWYSAVNVPEGSTTAPETDQNGFVQGICPVGWHIPTTVEMTALRSIPSEDTRTAELWLQPNNNTNSTEFTSLPAGEFNATTERFQGLYSQTDYWTDNATSAAQLSALQINYYCDTPMMVNRSADDAVSVRCVKNH